MKDKKTKDESEFEDFILTTVKVMAVVIPIIMAGIFGVIMLLIN